MSNQLVNEVYSTDAIPNQNIEVFQNYESGFSIINDIYNNLDIPVIIYYRDGSKIVYQPRNNHQRSSRLYCTRRVELETSRTSVILPELNQNPVAQYIHDCYHRASPTAGGNAYLGPRQVVQMQYTIDRQDLLDKRFIYYKNLDIAISLVNTTQKYYHPYSPEGMAIRRENSFSKEPEPGFSIRVHVYTNQRHRGPKYINLAGHVFQIPCHYSLEQNPGIYFTYSNLMSPDGENVLPLRTEYFKFDDDRKMPFNLYDTYADAISLGDTSSKFEREIAELKHQISLDKLELERVKQEEAKRVAEHEMWLAKKKREEEDIADQRRRHQMQWQEQENRRKALEKERDMMEEQLRRSREAEMQLRMMDRKDTSEFLKWVPTILTGLIGLATVIYKAKA